MKTSSTFVENCPRCAAQKTTFDVFSAKLIEIKYGWQEFYEAFCVCRHCNHSTTFLFKQKDIESNKITQNAGFLNIQISLNDYFINVGHISLSNNSIDRPPLYLPEKINDVFIEASRCHSIGCFNASVAMFRLCLDLATKDLLPKDMLEEIATKTKKDLGLRLNWLIENEILPKELKRLATCIKDDGNAGVHDGTITKIEAEDIKDFAFALLERLYTEPEKLRIAENRISERRTHLKK